MNCQDTFIGMAVDGSGYWRAIIVTYTAMSLRDDGHTWYQKLKVERGVTGHILAILARKVSYLFQITRPA